MRKRSHDFTVTAGTTTEFYVYYNTRLVVRVRCVNIILSYPPLFTVVCRAFNAGPLGGDVFTRIIDIAYVCSMINIVTWLILLYTRMRVSNKLTRVRRFGDQYITLCASVHDV